MTWPTQRFHRAPSWQFGWPQPAWEWYWHGIEQCYSCRYDYYPGGSCHSGHMGYGPWSHNLRQDIPQPHPLPRSRIPSRLQATACITSPFSSISSQCMCRGCPYGPVIQLALRKSILNALHAAYQGVSAMRAWAMDSGLLWLDITADIAWVRDQCSNCHQAIRCRGSRQVHLWHSVSRRNWHLMGDHSSSRQDTGVFQGKAQDHIGCQSTCQLQGRAGCQNSEAHAHG